MVNKDPQFSLTKKASRFYVREAYREVFRRIDESLKSRYTVRKKIPELEAQRIQYNAEVPNRTFEDILEEIRQERENKKASSTATGSKEAKQGPKKEKSAPKDKPTKKLTATKGSGKGPAEDKPTKEPTATAKPENVPAKDKQTQKPTATKGPEKGLEMEPEIEPEMEPGTEPETEPEMGPVKGPIKGPVEGPVNGPIERPVNGPIERPVEEPKNTTAEPTVIATESPRPPKRSSSEMEHGYVVDEAYPVPTRAEYEEFKAHIDSAGNVVGWGMNPASILRQRKRFKGSAGVSGTLFFGPPDSVVEVPDENLDSAGLKVKNQILADRANKDAREQVEAEGRDYVEPERELTAEEQFYAQHGVV